MIFQKKEALRYYLVLLLMSVFLFACGTNSSSSKSTVTDDTNTELETQTEIETQNEMEHSEEAVTVQDDSLQKLRLEMEPSAAVAGIFYLGYYDGTAFDTAFLEIPEVKQCFDRYPFLSNITNAQYAKNDGAEIYCIVPADPDALVTVTKWDANTESPGEILYQSDNGNPFFVQGNASDIMSNLAISIQDNFNNQLQNYHPSISLNDGRVTLPTDSEPLILDFTISYETN